MHAGLIVCDVNTFCVQEVLKTANVPHIAVRGIFYTPTYTPLQQRQCRTGGEVIQLVGNQDSSPRLW
eukprot:4924746-Karenia_brevis.AAC.1